MKYAVEMGSNVMVYRPSRFYRVLTMVYNTELLGFRTLSIVRIFFLVIIKIRTMDKVRNPSNSVWYTDQIS
jgi:hypothetical protein